MRNVIETAPRARYWLTLLIVFLIIISPTSSLNVMATTAAACTSPLWQVQSDDLELSELLIRNARNLMVAGKYDEAIPIAERALAICEKAAGPYHPYVAADLTSLAQLYLYKGDYAKAEPLFLRALAIAEKAFGPNEPFVARILHNFAVLYVEKGDYAKAELLYQRALAIREKTLRPGDPDLSTSLYSLASLYHLKGDYAKAEPLFLRALAILEEWLRPFQSDDYPLLATYIHQLATLLNNLGVLYRAKGEYAKVEPLCERALAITEKAFGPNHPNVAQHLNNIASLYVDKGDYVKAELLFQRALAINEKALNPDHPNIANTLNHLARLYEAKNDVTQAVAFRLRATDISERNIALNLITGSERQKLLYFATFSSETDQTVSLHVLSAPNEGVAQRLALKTILRRKGRVLDATGENFAALQRRLNPQDRSLLDQLTETRSRLATLVLGGPGKTDPAQLRAEIKRLEEQAEKLEAQISTRSAEFRLQSQPVTLESVQAAIPPDAALVEYVSYRPYNVKKGEWEARRYVAYVLNKQGEPAWVNLGEAAEIDKLVNELRAILRWDDIKKPLSDIEREVKPKARLFDQKIMQPVRKLLGDKRKLLVSPDGALNLIPFAALVDEQGKYLIESYSLTYLTTGRDLLRLKEYLPSKQGMMIVANPNYGSMSGESVSRGVKSSKPMVTIKGKATTPAKEEATPTNAIDFSQIEFPPLEGTEQEAQALKAMMPEATTMMRDQATKAAVQKLNAPSILHVATHGFYLENLVTGSADNMPSLSIDRQPNASAMHVEDPLKRSGLALAGANLHKRDDNGILTALEVSGLNLWGTKLVVLSACETGIGEVQNFNGVVGLRRALVLAGSESQMLSLWKVDDEATRDLMIDYYRRLKAGEGRSEALRQVQLKMLATPSYQHPYFWASFIESGEWANLDGKR